MRKNLNPNCHPAVCRGHLGQRTEAGPPGGAWMDSPPSEHGAGKRDYCSLDQTSTASGAVRHDHTYCKSHNCTRRGRKNQGSGTNMTDVILKSNEEALVHTGISVENFHILVATLQPYNDGTFTMSVQAQVLMTLMKLKSNRPLGELSAFFKTSESMASQVILFWIDHLEVVLRPAVPWLPKKAIQATMPAEFKKNFPNTTCFLGYRESVLHKPRNLGSQARSPNTVKYLLAVAPCGLITFISTAYAERCDEKDMTANSGILDLLMPGDEVMTHGGLRIKDLLFKRRVNLVMSSLSNDSRQPAEENAPSSEQIAHVVMHVEEAIRYLNTYKILSQGVSTTLAPQIDKILRICAALTNLRVQLLN
ncbi:uncharacterized protein si:dkey-56d12.4 isoform X1 [Dunckerocampus dactyliophorus]|uniref:uncharacterized protein si:dkey-56d12.4 isoform X1 n=1 Tax=Dunckerocampus dactyliophorus TaxID=161453 RepID=UPI0024074163|nr:uncharacterized protein si:dkey-56d12.4 isoform X1 [Dunckerocampus dactyliophorus]